MQHTIRTHVRDAILCGVSESLIEHTVRAVESAGVIATEEACWNRHHLVDFDEYRRGAL